MNWMQQLEQYMSLLKEIVQKYKERHGQFRFNRSVIIASDVAQQYFCEKKVEMQYVHGKVETKLKLRGTEAHEKLLEDTIPIKREELWKKIYDKKPVFVYEMFLLAKFKDVILAGKPDSIFFTNGTPLVIFEYKSGRSRRPFRSHYAQVSVYGTLLKNTGFDTGRLYYVIVLARPEARSDQHFKHKVVAAVVKNGPNEAEITVGNARIYITKFNPVKAYEDLDWATGFWKNNRDAIPTKNINKCRSCEYNKEYDQSLARSIFDLPSHTVYNKHSA